MTRPITDYITLEEFNKIKEFAKDKQTPFLAIDLKKIEHKYNELIKNLPYAKVYYAIKANPHEDVIKLLEKKGCCFDIASIYELDQLLNLEISPERISFGNTIKKERDIAYAYTKGIRLFATDSKSDLLKLARSAPGAKVFFRIICECSGADWPLSKKFGAHRDLVYKLILEAKNLNLVPYGISFHVGSQQRDVGQWDDAIGKCKQLFDDVEKQGIHLKLINMGGGFPANYQEEASSIERYSEEITRYLKEDFGETLPEIIIEPGRSLVADAGVIVSEVVMISKKAIASHYDWVFLDIGKFGGLIETIDECIRYPIYTERAETDPERKSKSVIIAGPTCDSMDVLYEDNKYSLPVDLKEGEKVFVLTTGAYTQTYSSTYFNGFPPLKAYILDGQSKAENINDAIKKQQDEKYNKQIMVVAKHALFAQKYFEGFSPQKDFNYERIVANNYEFMKRGIAEQDFSFKQPIPYIVVVNPRLKKIFAYQRASKKELQFENRLHGRWSLGVGGHIDKEDNNGAEDNVLIKAMLRELGEEIEINDSITTRILGYINDDSTEVGKVHIGILYLIETDAENIKPKGKEMVSGGFKSIEEIDEILNSKDCIMEDWSKIAIPLIRDILK